MWRCWEMAPWKRDGGEKKWLCKSYTNQKHEGDKSSGEADKKTAHFCNGNCSGINAVSDITDNKIGPQ